MRQRITHTLLLIVALGIPIATVAQAMLGDVDLGPLGSAGILAGSVVAVLTNLRAFLPSPGEAEFSVLRRVSHWAGTAGAVLSPVLVVLASGAGGKVSLGLAAATVSGLLVELGKVFPKESTPVGSTASPGVRKGLDEWE